MRQIRVGRSGPPLVSVAALSARCCRWEGEDAASARARSALQLVCEREWEAAGLRLWPSRLTAPTPHPPVMNRFGTRLVGATATPPPPPKARSNENLDKIDMSLGEGPGWPRRGGGGGGSRGGGRGG